MTQLMRKPAIPLLATSEFAAILERITDAVFALDARGRFTYVNSAAVQVLRQSAEELLGRFIWEAIPDVLDAETSRQIRQAVATGTPVEFETFYDPLQIWAYVRVFPSTEGLTVLFTDVTAHKQAEAQLAESHRLLQAIMEYAPEGISIADRHGKHIMSSKSAIRIDGRDPDATPTIVSFGSTVSAFRADGMTPLPIEEWPLSRAVRDGVEISNEEMVLKRADGHEIPLLCNAAPLRNADGQIDGGIIIFRDITVRKQAENHLAQERELLQCLLDAIPVMITIYDPNMRTFRFNQEARKLLGWTEDDAANGKLMEKAYPDPVYRQKVADFMQSLETGWRDFVVTAKDGSVVDSSWANIRLTNDTQIGIGIDIRQRKRLEEQLQRERIFLETVIDVFPLPVTFLAPSGEIIRLNRAADEFTDRYFAQGCAGVTPVDPHTGKPIPLDNLPAVQALLGMTVTNYEQDFILPDKRQVPVMVHAAPIHDEKGEMSGAVVAWQDITDLRELQQAKDEFLAVLSHELQTPLTSMLGWSELALERDTLEVFRLAIPVVQRNARRQKRLINQLLDMSRLLHGRLLCVPEPVNLRELAITAVEQLVPAAEQGGVELSLAPLADDLPVIADPARMLQCLEHLIGNSIKYTASGGEISVMCCRNDGEAVLTVRDTGRGIAPEILPTLFAPFRQVDRDEATGGLGLGLAITRGIIELHNGTVTATSPGPCLGSTFTVRLPLRP